MSGYKKEIRLIGEKPMHGGTKTLAKWKSKISALRQTQEIKHKSWVKKIQNQWPPKEWEGMRNKLEKLTLKDLANLTTRVGIEFSEGNKSVKNNRNITAKEQFILVLDEADKKKLILEYKKILKSRK